MTGAAIFSFAGALEVAGLLAEEFEVPEDPLAGGEPPSTPVAAPQVEGAWMVAG